MEAIIGIDPSIRGCGVAYVREKKLVRAVFVPNKLPGSDLDAMAQLAWDIHLELEKADMPMNSHAFIEFPQVYRFSKAPPNSLLVLAGTCGAVAAQSSSWCWKISTVNPHAWKGGVPKETFFERILSRLSPEEKKAVILTKNKKHNGDITDAIGLALWGAKRL